MLFTRNSHIAYMGITRPGETPAFYRYPVDYALTSSKLSSDDWPDSVQDFDPNPIQIPPYQRKIVWGKKQVSDFIESNSILFGTVILASEGSDKSIILLDGLQRFATATAILNFLYPLVLSPEPVRQDISDNFKLLKSEVSSKQPIFEHNDNMLRNYTRKGIAESYTRLVSAVKSVITEELENDPEGFAKHLTKTFVIKQIAIDTYFGFKNRSELTHTFININSTGIDLSEVDLLRSEIVQQADNMKWNDDDIDEMENSFTDIFQSNRIKGVKVLGKNLYDSLSEDPTKVFENWNKLEKSHVDDLLNFVDDFNSAVELENDEGEKEHPYLYEIVQCGDLPFALTLWYFYKHVHLQGKTPDILGGDFDTTTSRHALLRAFYRRVIDGSIGRIGPIVSNFIKEKDDPKITSMQSLANLINQDIGAGDLDSEPDEGWIKTSLRRAGANRARRIFNACLLPDREDSGGNFTPIDYGTKINQWNIDHMIPKINKKINTMGAEEIDEIMNMVPLPSDVNVKAKHYPCERKLNDAELYSTVKEKHPYLNWLVNEHFSKFKDAEHIDGEHPLNLPQFLMVNADPSIGDDRIDQIAKLLKNKI